MVIVDEHTAPASSNSHTVSTQQDRNRMTSDMSSKLLQRMQMAQGMNQAFLSQREKKNEWDQQIFNESIE